MSEVKLNWSTAEVKDAELTVELEGETPPGWKDSFKMTAKLLGDDSDWGKVRLKKQAVRVRDVSPDSEPKLRHHLESLVEQANAATRPPESDAKQEDDDKDSGPDEQMAERFRAFAPEGGGSPAGQGAV